VGCKGGVCAPVLPSNAQPVYGAALRSGVLAMRAAFDVVHATPCGCAKAMEGNAPSRFSRRAENFACAVKVWG